MNARQSIAVCSVLMMSSATVALSQGTQQIITRTNFHKSGEVADVFQCYMSSSNTPVANGWHRSYLRDGALLKEETYKDGLRHGPARLILEGELTVVNWENGKQEGPKVSFYTNGQVASVAYYEKGEPKRVQFTWTPDGKRMGMAEFVDGCTPWQGTVCIKEGVAIYSNGVAVVFEDIMKKEPQPAAGDYRLEDKAKSQR